MWEMQRKENIFGTKKDGVQLKIGLHHSECSSNPVVRNLFFRHHKHAVPIRRRRRVDE